MEIYVFVLVILAGLIWLAVWLSKGSGYKEAELKQADEYIKEVMRQHKQGKENAKDIANLTDDELIDRLSK